MDDEEYNLNNQSCPDPAFMTEQRLSHEQLVRESREKMPVEYRLSSERMGRGAYASVYKVNRDLVAKVFNSVSGIVDDSTLRELASLRLLRTSEHTMELYKIDVEAETASRTRIKAYMPLYKNMLTNYTRGRLRVDSNSRKWILYQLFCGLQEMSNRNIIHRDLKPDNIGVSSEGSLAIFDFGLSRFIDAGDVKNAQGLIQPNNSLLTTEVQTLWWRSPEIFLGMKNYDFKIDLWSAGIIMLEFYRARGFLLSNPDVSESGTLHKMFSIFGTPRPDEGQEIETYDDFALLWYGLRDLPNWNPDWPQYPRQSLIDIAPELSRDPDALDLLNRILVYDPRRRIRLGDIFKHPYFNREELPVPEGVDFYAPELDLEPFYKFYLTDFGQPRVKLEDTALRAQLVNRLVDTGIRYGVRYVGIFLALIYFDMYASPENLEHPQLTIIALLEIANKVTQTTDDLVRSAFRDRDPEYQVLRRDTGLYKTILYNILQELDYNLYQVSEYNYLRYYNKYYNIDPRLFKRICNTIFDLLASPQSRRFTKCELVKSVLKVYGIIPDDSTGDLYSSDIADEEDIIRFIEDNIRIVP